MKVPPLLPGLVCATGLVLVFPLDRAAAQQRLLREAHAYSQPATSLSPEFDPELRREPRFRNIFPRTPILETRDDELGSLPFPSPTPVPTIIPSPTPSIPPQPTPTIAPTTTPVPSIPPTPVPSPPSPAFPAPAPNPAPSIAMPTRPIPAPPSIAPSVLYVQQLTPVIEIWRESALTPELPPRRGKHVGPVAVPANEVVNVRLQFGLLATGKAVVVTASGGVRLNPPQQVLAIQPSADCVMTVGLSDGYSNGAIRFYCEGISTLLTLSRVAPETQPLTQTTTNGARR